MARRLTPGRAAALAACSAIVCAGAGCNGPWRHDMVDGASRPAGAGPRSAAPGTMPVDGELRDTPAARVEAIDPTGASAAVARGRALYGVYCAPCHGMSGAGDGPVATYFPAVGDLT